MYFNLFNRLSRSLRRIAFEMVSQKKLFCKCPVRSLSGSVNDKFVVKEQYVQKYLELIKREAEESPNACTNEIPNSMLINMFTSRQETVNNLQALRNIENDKMESKEWKETLQEEILQYEEQLTAIDLELIYSLVPKSPDFNAVEFEITAGIGGKEAMLFAKELFDMYQNYFYYKSWAVYVAEINSSELGGIRHASFCVEGPKVLKSLQFEAGVHRVQRVPATEKSGRMHTSTVTVSVYPQPAEFELQISDKDIIIETKRSSGAGGQHVNTTDSCVRITHIPTGIIIECQTERSQIKNKKIALGRLRSKIYQIELHKQEQLIRDIRKSQVGTSARSDKVRTYNYAQDRITDHRIPQSWHNLLQFLKGGQMLDENISMLKEYFDKENLRTFLASLKSKS